MKIYEAPKAVRVEFPSALAGENPSFGC
jgi:hypothetical protein